MKFQRFFVVLIAMVFSAPGQILPPQSRVEGRTVSEWTAEYWNWIYQAPTNQNPRLETNGTWAHFRQPDANVSFLAGASGLDSNTVTRTFTVPETKYILLPVLAAEANNIDRDPVLLASELRAEAERSILDPGELHLVLDGVPSPLTNLLAHREISPSFSLTLAAPDNFATWKQGHSITGLVDPMVSDGYWLMLKPLALGPHVLSYGGTSSNSPLSPNNVIANITVVPVSPSELIASLTQSVQASGLSVTQQLSLVRSLKAAASVLGRKPPHRSSAVSYLRTFQRQVSVAFKNDPATAANLLQRARIVVNRILSQAPPITNGGVLPANTSVAGKSIGGLEAGLWNWIYSIPTNQNPLLDCGSGQWATNRQPNPLVFYIAPVNGNMPPCSRTFTVPEHKHILMPVMAVTIDDIFTDPPLTIPEMREILDSALTIPVALFATIDGVGVPNLIDHRNTGPEFTFNFLDADNVQSFFYETIITGLVDPIIADGYWLLLEPLSTGSHLLHGGGQNIYHLPHDVTSNITVEEVPLEQWMEALKSWVRDTPASASLASRFMPGLNHAESLFRRGRIGPGIAELRSFQNRVRIHLRTREPALASDLIRYAERIINRAGKEL